MNFYTKRFLTSNKCTLRLWIMLFLVFGLSNVVAASSAIKSLMTPYTISLIRSANYGSEKIIVGSSYDGTLIALNYEGDILWENPLSGYYNQDIYCYDIDEDGKDEVLAANADGTVYCVDDDGLLLWAFKVNEAPMYSVCGMEVDGKPIVVCGGYDMNFYCLSPDMSLLQTVHTSDFTKLKGWGNAPSGSKCTVNFVRPYKDANGKELLAMHGAVYANSTDGMLHLIEIKNGGKSYSCFKQIDGMGGACVGSFWPYSPTEGGQDRLLVGGSNMEGGSDLHDFDLDTGEAKSFIVSELKGSNSKGDAIWDDFGYRVMQGAVIPEGDSYRYFALIGSRIFYLKSDMTFDVDDDAIVVGYSFNDMAQDSKNNYIILASAQSGGNCVHIIDINNKDWKEQMYGFQPPGNITKILESAADLWAGLAKFQRPFWETARPKVYYMSDNKDNPAVIEYEHKYPSAQVFLDNGWGGTMSQDPATWSRDTMSNELYRNKRDARRKYASTKEECIAGLLKAYEDGEGSAYWGGHGNDPFYFAPDTWNTLFEQPKVQGKTTVLIYPEMTSVPGPDFDYAMRVLFMPLARKRAEGTDVKIYVRNKDLFWLSGVHMDPWNPLRSGEFSDAFVPSMEETTARTQDLSIAGRMGIWTAGCVESWGSRVARDNPSHDRMRQFSHQMLPNHFLRNMVYYVSMGSQYLDNFAVDQEYMKLLWEMVGSGLLYVPRREELLSISPVHLAMDEPSELFLEKCEEVKWTTYFDEDKAVANGPFVFDRIRAGWMSSAVTEHDFSRYAAGVQDRRLNFIPPYPNGMVVISPGKELSTSYRKPLNEQLHPIYRDIMKTYHTDGKDYIVNGVKKDADTYYKTIEADIKESVKKLPLNVDGDEVAWVVAQSAPKHLRLTVIDGGYINPDDRSAFVHFHTVNPVSITDLVTGERYLPSGNKDFEITVPTGMFRFFDIELEEEL